jgi:hypothetical protein
MLESTVDRLPAVRHALSPSTLIVTIDTDALGSTEYCWRLIP